MGQTKNVAPKDPSMLAELVHLAFGDEPLAGSDTASDVGAAERKCKFKERHAATLSKRVRQHG